MTQLLTIRLVGRGAPSRSRANPISLVIRTAVTSKEAPSEQGPERAAVQLQSARMTHGRISQHGAASLVPLPPGVPAALGTMRQGRGITSGPHSRAQPSRIAGPGEGLHSRGGAQIRQ